MTNIPLTKLTFGEITETHYNEIFLVKKQPSIANENNSCRSKTINTNQIKPIQSG
jgi:hypothetical protein